MHGNFSYCTRRSKRSLTKQMKFGAKQAQNDYLWFLHCDTRLQKKTILKVKSQIKKYPDEIHFLQLHFLNDGPYLMRLNTIGTWIRSQILGIPFGDQGFCMHKNTFAKLKGFCG